MDPIAQLKAKYEPLQPLLNERQRRVWAATEALALGRGGLTWVAAATGLSRRTVRAGVDELRQQQCHPEETLAANRVRRSGGAAGP